MCACVCTRVIFPPNDLLRAWHQNLHQLPSRKETTKGNPRVETWHVWGGGRGQSHAYLSFRKGLTSDFETLNDILWAWEEVQTPNFPAAETEAPAVNRRAA